MRAFKAHRAALLELFKRGNLRTQSPHMRQERQRDCCDERVGRWRVIILQQGSKLFFVHGLNARVSGTRDKHNGAGARQFPIDRAGYYQANGICLE